MLSLSLCHRSAWRYPYHIGPGGPEPRMKASLQEPNKAAVGHACCMDRFLASEPRLDKLRLSCGFRLAGSDTSTDTGDDEALVLVNYDNDDEDATGDENEDDSTTMHLILILVPMMIPVVSIHTTRPAANL